MRFNLLFLILYFILDICILAGKTNEAVKKYNRGIILRRQKKYKEANKIFSELIKNKDQVLKSSKKLLVYTYMNKASTSFRIRDFKVSDPATTSTQS
jgi:hypothetical protein